MLLSFVLNAGKHGHGMDGLSERYLGHTPMAYKDVCGTGKKQIPFSEVPLDVATQYAAEDADITLRLWKLFKPQLVADKVTTVYETLERPLVPVIAQIEREGIKVDRDHLSRLSSDFAQSMARLEADAYEQAGREFKLGSPKQLGEILFDEMDLPKGARKPKRVPGKRARMFSKRWPLKVMHCRAQLSTGAPFRSSAQPILKRCRRR